MDIIGMIGEQTGGYCKNYLQWEINQSKELILKFVMDKYKITDKDLENCSIIRSKIRDIKLDNIINKNNGNI